MIDINSTDEYDDWVESIARTTLGDGYPEPERVAPMCVVAFEQVGDETSLLSVAEPYHDSRAYPKDIIKHSPRELPPGDQVEDYRDVAVTMLTADIRDTQRDPEQREMEETMCDESTLDIGDIESAYKVLEFMRDNGELFDETDAERINTVHCHVQEYEQLLFEEGVIHALVPTGGN